MWIRLSVLLLLLSGIEIIAAQSAQAYIGLCCSKCGGNMPLNIPGGGVPETHELRLKLSPMYMSMDGLRNDTSSLGTDSLLTPEGSYMAVPTDMDMSMLNVSAAYSFSDRLVGGVMGMWKRSTMDMEFNGMMKKMTGDSGFTMRSDGMGDTMVMLKYRACADDPLIPTSQISFMAGVSIPTGSIDEKNKSHPVDMRRGELLPYGMQLGSGTFDPSFAVLYQGSRSPWWWGANLSYTARLYDNRRNYHLGNETRVDLYAMYQLRYDLVAQVQLNARHQGKIRGEMDEAHSGDSGHMMQGNPQSPLMSPLWDPDHYGGLELFTTLGLQWQPIPMHVIDLQVGLPVYRRLNGPQLERDYRVMLTWYIEIPTPWSIRHRRAGKGKSRIGF